MCVVALILGMLMFHLLKGVCGCKNVEGNFDTPVFENADQKTARIADEDARKAYAQGADYGPVAWAAANQREWEMNHSKPPSCTGCFGDSDTALCDIKFPTESGASSKWTPAVCESACKEDSSNRVAEGVWVDNTCKLSS